MFKSKQGVQPQHSEESPASPGACGAIRFPMEAALLTPDRQTDSRAGATPVQSLLIHTPGCAVWVLSAAGLFLILRSL